MSEMHPEYNLGPVDEAVKNVRTDLEALKREALNDLIRHARHNPAVDHKYYLGQQGVPNPEWCEACRCIAKWEAK